MWIFQKAAEVAQLRSVSVLNGKLLYQLASTQQGFSVSLISMHLKYNRQLLPLYPEALGG